MTAFPSPLQVTLANVKLAGYLIETQCRVAQVLMLAALKSSPFKPSKSYTCSVPADVPSLPETGPAKPKRQPSPPPPLPTRPVADLQAS